MGFHVCMVGALLLLCMVFDDDSEFARSLLLNLFTRYSRDDKNNLLSIFMLSGSIQFSLHFILTQIMRLFSVYVATLLCFVVTYILLAGLNFMS